MTWPSPHKQTMLSNTQQKKHILLAGAGALSAALAVGLLSLFPGARLAGFILIILACGFFWLSGVTDRSGNHRAGWVRTPLDLPILMLIFQTVVSFWATAFPETTWIAASRLVAGLVAYFVIVNWSQNRPRLWWAIGVTIVLGLGLALIAPFAVDWTRDRTPFLPEAIYQFFPLLLPDPVHHNVMAASLITLIPLPLALALALPVAPRRQLWLRVALLLICLVEISIVILTQSRGGYLALGAGLWLTLWLSGKRQWAIGFAIVVGLLIVWMVTRLPAEPVEGLNPTQTVLDPSTWSFRQQVWAIAFQVIGDFPFTGVGVGTFNDVATLMYGFYSPGNPGAHNLLLQAGVDLGLFGLISLLAILFLVLWAAYQALRLFDACQERNLQAAGIGCFSGIVATIAHGMIDLHTWGTKGAFILWTIIGLTVALYGLAMMRSSDGLHRREPLKPHL